MTRLQGAALSGLARVLYPFVLQAMFCCLVFVPVVVQAARLDIPSSFNPVGSGARALGMGGAFIGVADDATAASWNPAGLIQLEAPEISVVGSFFQRTEDNSFGTNPEAAGKEKVSLRDLNYLSLAYPFSIRGYNMIVSLNYQRLYDFSRKWDFPLQLSSPIMQIDSQYQIEQDGNLSALGLAYGLQLSPRLSLGVTMNLWEDWLGDNSWKQVQRVSATATNLMTSTVTQLGNEDYYDRYEFSGLNFNLGLLWNVTPKLTLGAVLKTPFTADLQHRSSQFAGVNEEELEMPMSYGLGLAYRFSDEFTVSADIYRTEWDDFALNDGMGSTVSPVSGLATSASEVDPTHQIRMGMEYLIIDMRREMVFPLRAGLFFDPAPAESNPDNYFGFSLGSGVAYKQFLFDVAYQYRFGNDIGDSILQSLDFSQDVDEHTLYASVIIHF